MVTTPPTAAVRKVRIWDPVVRVFHWTVAGGVLANLTFFRNQDDWHVYIGYVVVAALTIRLGWGLMARGHSRFTSFVPTPRKLLWYFRAMLNRHEPRYVGHNPAGAAMIVVLLLLLAIVGATGWMMGVDAFWGIGWVEELHELSANALIGAIGLHVTGAIFESIRHRENLPLAMITGYKRPAEGTDIDNAAVVSRR